MFEHFRIENLIVLMANILAGLVIDTTNFLSARLQFVQETIQADLAEQTLVLIADADQQTNTILDAITQAAIQAALDATNNTDRIIDTVSAAVVTENRAATAATGTALGGISTQVAEVESSLSVLSGQVGTGLTTQNNILTGIFDLLAAGMQTTIINQITIDASIFDFVVAQVSSVVNAAAKENAGVLVSLGNVFKGIVDNLLGVFLAAQTARNPELVAIASAILHNKDKNTAVLEKQLDETDEGIGAKVMQSVIEQVAPQIEITGDELQKSLADFIGGPNPFECLGDMDIDQLFTKEGVNKFVVSLINIIAEAAGFVAMPLAMTGARTRALMFEWMACHPIQPLPVAESILSLHRGIITPDAATINILKQGYKREDVDRIIQVGQVIPDITFIYNMFYRDLIDDSGFDFSLKALGFAEGFIEPLKELAFFIPPVQDLITMAVREVFSPEIAQAQGQFEDFPEDFAKFARQQGVSRAWAENYWAAHWSLPSVQMGYEMLHRGVITEERLKGLLRALDVMPFWRDPLIKISFRPFTRVDIRRMHRVGVLTDGDVLLAYLNLGYDQTNAGLLRDFVLELNKEDEIITFDVASDLTRSSILSFYKDGIISGTVARALLIQAGINVAAAELFILGADFDIERRDRKQSLNIILDQFRFDGLTFFEAADRIAALGFETEERKLAEADLESLRVRETKLPSKADLDKFLKADLLTDDEYLDQLGRLGIPPVWADKYLTLISKAA